MDSELKPDPNVETLRSIAALASAAVERSQSPQNMRLVGAGVAVALTVAGRPVQVCASSEDDLFRALFVFRPNNRFSASDVQRVLIYAADNP